MRGIESIAHDVKMCVELGLRGEMNSRPKIYSARVMMVALPAEYHSVTHCVNFHVGEVPPSSATMFPTNVSPVMSRPCRVYLWRYWKDNSLPVRGVGGVVLNRYEGDRPESTRRKLLIASEDGGDSE